MAGELTSEEGLVVTVVPPDEARLSAETHAVLAQFVASQRYDPSLTPAERRKLHEKAFMPLGLADADRAHVSEFWLPRRGAPVRVRLYRPKQGATPPPLIIYFHGGGMTVGSLEQYDSLCQRLCERSGVAVLSVDYALSPEKPFPAAVEDAWFALCWAHENGQCLGFNASRLAVGGDSAGGNLSAVLTLMARDQNGPPLVFQLLIYPAVGTRGGSYSTIAYASGYLFEKANLDTVYAQYLPDTMLIEDWRVSPILATNHANLPPAFVVAAEYEIMRDDIEDYARLLQEAGGKAEYKCYAGMVHPFLSLAGLVPQGAQAIDDCAERLADAFKIRQESADMGNLELLSAIRKVAELSQIIDECVASGSETDLHRFVAARREAPEALRQLSIQCDKAIDQLPEIQRAETKNDVNQKRAQFQRALAEIQSKWPVSSAKLNLDEYQRDKAVFNRQQDEYLEFLRARF
jgi:acetyl esterase